MTQIQEARKGNITPDMEAVARAEGVTAELVRQGVADGTIVITRNREHTNITPLGVGKGLRTKINANIGTSKERMSVEGEIEKLLAAVSSGADAVMDLSTGGPIIGIRKEILLWPDGRQCGRRMGPSSTGWRPARSGPRLFWKTFCGNGWRRPA